MLATRMWTFAATSLAAFLVAGLVPDASAAGGTNGPAHGIAMHGAPKYPKGFKNYDYVNPNAPKGGKVVLGALGTFDSFHPYIVKGNRVGATTLDALMVSNLDEAFTKYCHLCETVEVPDDRSWIEFALRPEARWHDGKPITVEDVIWSFDTLREKGLPFYRSYYKDVVKVEQTGPRKVKFSFDPKVKNDELPLIMGELPVLPKHWWSTRDFTATTLEPPLGSGPYRLKTFEAGRSITMERVKDYWGASLPTSAGFSNFDEMRTDFYRDQTVLLEAFKGGNVDFRAESVARNWATAYDTPAVHAGLIKKEEIKHSRVAGMQGWVFNIRRPLFQDRRVREALTYTFDFEWSNANLFFNAYTRTDSFWDNSELGSRGKFADLAPDSEERKILERFRGKVPEEVFTAEFKPFVTDGTGNNRDGLRRAGALLDAAGWTVRDGKRVNAAGRPFAFEILLSDPSFERVALPFKEQLEKLGLTITVRTVDSSQYQQRTDAFDYDMLLGSWGQSESPGNEQRDMWSSAAADQNGTRNDIGIKDPAIDELIELVVQASDRKSLVERTRALDRVLLWGHYLIPHYHTPYDRIASWDKFSRPSVIPARGTSFGSWWIDPAKDASLVTRRAALR